MNQHFLAIFLYSQSQSSKIFSSSKILILNIWRRKNLHIFDKIGINENMDVYKTKCPIYNWLILPLGNDWSQWWIQVVSTCHARPPVIFPETLRERIFFRPGWWQSEERNECPWERTIRMSPQTFKDGKFIWASFEENLAWIKANEMQFCDTDINW